MVRSPNSVSENPDQQARPKTGRWHAPRITSGDAILTHRGPPCAAGEFAPRRIAEVTYEFRKHTDHHRARL
jgi:hypothetical protein